MKSLPALVGLIIVGATGLTHGLLTDRWRPSTEVRAAAEALGRVPAAVGDWSGRDLEIDPATLTVAGAAGHVYRRYENRRTGAAATILILCGRPGPISLHPPEVCYGGRGYDMVRPPAPRRVPGYPTATFRVGDLNKADAAVPDHLRVLWAWRAAGPWQTPDDPRLAFASSPFLYKLYAVRGTGSVDESIEGDACLDLLGRLLPELDKVLGPGRPGRGPA